MGAILGLAGASAAAAAVTLYSEHARAAPVVVVAPPPPAIAPPPPPLVPTASSAPPACSPMIVPFAFGSSALDRNERARIGALGRALAAKPERTVLLHGHADALGSDEANLALSRTRAQSVATELAAAGIARSRITVRGFGAYQPVEGAPEEAASNRRVVIYLRDGESCVPADGEEKSHD